MLCPMSAYTADDHVTIKSIMAELIAAEERAQQVKFEVSIQLTANLNNKRDHTEPLYKTMYHPVILLLCSTFCVSLEVEKVVLGHEYNSRVST